jgi:hypothetical protein
MGRSVSYPSEALVVTFANPEYDCATCEEHGGKGKVPCDCSDPTSALSAEERAECEDCAGTGVVDCPADCYNGKRSMDELNLVDPRIPLTAQLRGVRRAAAHICDALAADNPRFDPTQFLKACGYGATSMNPRDPALDLRPLPDEATRRALNAR